MAENKFYQVEESELRGSDCSLSKEDPEGPETFLMGNGAVKGHLC